VITLFKFKKGTKDKTNKSIQKAGTNSQQYIVETMNVGTDEGRIHEIVDKKILQAEEKRTISQSIPNPANRPIQKNNLRHFSQLSQYFSGRTDILDTIYNQFQSDPSAAISLQQQNITGLGGVGKTQIALAYAYNHADMYTEAVWGIRAETESSIFSSCLELAQNLGFNTEQATDAQKLGLLLQNWQNNHDSWLFIFDNVEDENIVCPYISPAHKGHILFTSRKSDFRRLGQYEAINVDILSSEDAEIFMRKRLKNYPHLIDNADELDTLIERLGRFPLALEQATAYMWRTGTNCKLYLNELKEKGLETFEDHLSEPLAGYDRTVITTFKISYNALSKEAQQLFNLCTYMAPDKIPIDFFKQQADKFPKPLCKALTNENRIIAELLDYALVKRDGEFLDIHRFVQEIGRDQIKDSKVDWLYCCLEAVEATMPRVNDYGHREYRDWFEQINIHAEMIINYAEEKFANEADKKEKIGQVCHWLGVGNEKMAQYSHALEWHHKAVNIREKVLDKEHPATVATYSNIARIYDIQGDYPKALEWFYKALDICEKVLGKKHLYTAITYNNIALVYNNQGDYPKALEWLQEALDIKEEVLDKEHPYLATIYNNVAQVYSYSNQGTKPKALEWHLKALDIREKILGKEHPDTAITYNNIAGVYSAQGDYPKALELYHKALNIYEKELVKEHPDTATIYSNIAIVHANQGNYCEALKWRQKALEVNEKVFGKDHPATLMVRERIEEIKT